jgi:hypothetical protein
MHGLKPPLIHQDIKPANVLVAMGNYKITDFSLATVTAANRTHGLATVRYAAPEMLTAELGQVGPGTDLYALGHIAYEMALGVKLHKQQFPAVFEGNAGKEPPPNKWMMWHASTTTHPARVSEVVDGFPGGLSEVIARLITKPLRERYTSAAEMISDLSVLRGEVAGAAAIPAAPASPAIPAAQKQAVAPAVVAQAPVVAENGNGNAAAAAAPAAAVPPPATRYWVRLRNKVSGPFDLASMQRQVRQGTISRLHQVSTDQITWKAATEIEGLYGPAVV